jgi:uncharacterized protein (DUF2236 family)
VHTGHGYEGKAMTAEVYPAADGLIQRAAAAFAASVPEHPADDGFFGPASVTWRVNGDLSAPVAGLRSLLVQALHPLAMAGVDQHSDWRGDPAGRLASTAAYLVTITFGDKAAALRAAARVRKIHERVRGTDEVTGQPYAASDPDLLLWVHAGLVDSVLAAADVYGAPLTTADRDGYVAEMTVAAELVGVPAGRAPSTAGELADYLRAVRPVLALTPAAAESTRYLLDLPGLDEDMGGMWRDIGDAAVASLPEWAACMYGLLPQDLVTEQRREEVRQVLGVLDALYLGEPGVLEARQRIELRMRQARHA